MDNQDLIPDDEELRRKVADIARASGKSEDAVIREALNEYCEAHRPAQNGEAPSTLAGKETLFDVFERAGLIGCISGPPDMSTNPKYMEGFGESG